MMLTSKSQPNIYLDSVIDFIRLAVLYVYFSINYIFSLIKKARDFVLAFVISQRLSAKPNLILETARPRHDKVTRFTRWAYLTVIKMNSKELQSLAECPICLDVKKFTRIFQCVNGHIICKICFDKLQGKIKCPQGKCSFNDPPTRSLITENLIAQSYFEEKDGDR